MTFTSIDEFASSIVLDLEPGRPDLVEYLLGRLGWPTRRLTLEEIGEAVGLTKERVRQVEKRTKSKLDERESFYDEGLLDRAIDEVVAIEFYEDIPTKLRESGFLKSNLWSTNDLDSFIMKIGSASVQLRWKELKTNLQRFDSIVQKAERLIKEHRDNNGLVLMSTLQLANPAIDFKDSKLVAALRKKLFALVVTDNLLMAPKTPRARIRRVLTGQLLVAPEKKLRSREAFTGIERDLKGRGKRVRGEAADIMKCVSEAFSEFTYFEETDEICLGSASLEIDLLDSISRRMVGYLLGTPNKAAHILDLLAFCLDNAMNVSSAQHEALYGPELRSEDEVYFPVGHKPDPAVKMELIASADLRFRRMGNYLSYDPLARSGTLQINPLWIRSGIWYVPPNLSSAAGRQPEIQCSMCAAGKKFRTTPSNRKDILRIPSEFINHLVAVHRVGAMRRLSFKVTGTTLVVY